MSKTTPSDELRKFVTDFIDKWAEATAANNNAVLKKPEAAKSNHALKGRVTKAKNKLDELLRPFEQPSLPGMEDGPSSEILAGQYTARVEIEGGVLQELEVFFPDGTRIENFEYELIDRDVEGGGDGEGDDGEPAGTVAPEGPYPLPGDAPHGSGYGGYPTGQEARAAEAPDETGKGPVELTVVIPNDPKSTTRRTNQIQAAVGAQAVRTEAEGELFKVVFRFPDHAPGRAAADKVGADAKLKAFVTGCLVEPYAEAPSGPADEPIELQVQTEYVGERLQQFVEEVEAALDKKADDVSADDAGATLYFDYPTLKEAHLYKQVVEAVVTEGVGCVLVGDPKEARFSEQEVERIDAAPRKLEAHVSAGGTRLAPYCTRCVTIGHVAPGDEPALAGLPPGSECVFCGWLP